MSIYLKKLIALGTSQAIVVPKAIIYSLGWQPYDHVLISVDELQRIVVTRPTLEELQTMGHAALPKII